MYIGYTADLGIYIAGIATGSHAEKADAVVSYNKFL